MNYLIPRRISTKIYLVMLSKFLFAILAIIGFLQGFPTALAANIINQRLEVQLLTRNNKSITPSQNLTDWEEITLPKIFSYFPDNEYLASIAVNYFFERNAQEKAIPYLYRAAKSDSTNQALWRREASLAESILDWHLASYAWKKAGINPNVKFQDPYSQALIIDDFVNFDRWRKPISTLNVNDESITIIREGVEIFYPNNVDQRDQLGFFLQFNKFKITDSNCLEINIFTSLGSFLTIDLVIDDNPIRIVNYLIGENDWHKFHYFLSGQELNRILIGFSEAVLMDQQSPSYFFILKSLKLIEQNPCPNSIEQ